VGDSLNHIADVVKEISTRADIAIVTGGLGPTSDDITAEGIAIAADTSLVKNKDALKSIKDFFSKLNVPMPETNNKQAMLPSKAVCLHNPVGTAPGFFIKINRAVFFCLPGVPSEMKIMLSELVISEIKTIFGDKKKVNVLKTLSLFGLPEASVNEKLTGFENRFKKIKLGLCAKFPNIDIKLYSQSSQDIEKEKFFEDACIWIKKQVGEWIYSERGESIEESVGNLLKKENATIAVAESCTGGLIAHRLTNVAGSSQYFLFSGVTYSNEAKTSVLGVLPSTIKKYGAVHEETVKEMAIGAQKIAKSTYGLATSGIAGPGGGTADKPVGTICIGIATEKKVESCQFCFSFRDRSLNKEIFATMAMDILRKKLLCL
jgi:nicotinamide-nucleotide amidase